MFILLKLIKQFFLPPTLIAIGMAVSFFLLLRERQRLGKALLFLTLVTYYLLSIEPVAYLLAKTLETKVDISKLELKTEKIEAIIVLGAGISKRSGDPPNHKLTGTSWKRLSHGIELYKEYKGEIPMLYSGGSGDPFDTTSVEALLAKDYAMAMSIPEENFWIESSSRNTYENGVEIIRILDKHFPGTEKHRIILVTSAFHMPRSIRVMKKAGLDSIPSPPDSVTGVLELDPLSFFPSVSSFSRSSRSIHEWMGIGGYWLLGRI
jgi:uncharacterized SAM-binding protein YcdF (DUF218 family)